MSTWVTKRKFAEDRGLTDIEIDDLVENSWSIGVEYFYEAGVNLMIETDLDLAYRRLERWLKEAHDEKDKVYTCLYRHWSEDELLYIGISASAMTRTMQHRNGSEWFRKVDKITIEHFDRKSEARRAELESIRSENPKYNKAHTR